MSDLKQRLTEGLHHCGMCGQQSVEINSRGQWICTACLHEVRPDYMSALRMEAHARIEELEAEVLTWRKVAQSATPGGSEYMHPERVKSHIDEMREALHNARCDAVRQRRRAEAAEAKLATARNDALEEAAKACDDEADKCDDSAKWSGPGRYGNDCKAASYAMRDRAETIRALKSTNQTGKENE